jgi:peptidoglycan/LPS O-acetylase OafA/YrhL
MMIDPVTFAGDVIQGATALAGLLLVYLGSVATSYSAYEKAQQASVRASFGRRAWFACIGTVLAILAAMLALGAKALNNPCMAWAATVIILIALAWAIACAVLSAWEIR